MACKKCGAKTEKPYNGYCFSCAIEKRNKESPFVSTLPSWLTTFSNKILPPLFFLFIAVLALHFISSVHSTPLRINLGVVSITASTLSLYLATLML